MGNTTNSKNVLHIAVWEALSPEQHALFSGMAHQGETGEQTFEESVHHWVFIHELSHWWQACQHKIGQNHYSVEYGANRIAAAYWRLKDPAIMESNATRMTAVHVSMPNPVFQGIPKGGLLQ